ncbi:hypothetical protein PoB_002448100 [Plakobranchus ocellatus]|uniref:Uncharacterized protein n=1 Tax=Plakobranchus ocellatus TaxID=259542 RepID=A0AAV3ZTY0_9GAST|nr:hypothetical protein PoB_002448100 [Plakobranchus ocellatus]
MGAKLGKSGDDLAAWVEDKVRQDIERNDRQIEREERESQGQLKCKKLEMETQLKKIELESKHNVATATPKQGYGTQKPKIPLLSDLSQVDLYIERFERHAAAFGWHESEWVSCLANLLQDESLSVFLSLSPTESADYQSVKRVLLRRFNCDRNGFRLKFLSVKPQADEDFGTFINRAKQYF